MLGHRLPPPQQTTIDSNAHTQQNDTMATSGFLNVIACESKPSASRAMQLGEICFPSLKRTLCTKRMPSSVFSAIALNGGNRTSIPNNHSHREWAQKICRNSHYGGMNSHYLISWKKPPPRSQSSSLTGQTQITFTFPAREERTARRPCPTGALPCAPRLLVRLNCDPYCHLGTGARCKQCEYFIT